MSSSTPPKPDGPESGLDVVFEAWRATHPVRPFVYGESYYAQSHYLGRVRRLFSLVNPVNCLITQADIKEAQQGLASYQSSRADFRPSDRKLWRWRHIEEVAVHPETKQATPWFGRLCYFLPLNVPITFGMLALAPTAGAVAFWQWLNQSVNAAFNLSNSASGASSDQLAPVLKSYALATGVSCGIALGLRRFGGKLASAPWLVPYLAVAGAGSANNFFMRRAEVAETGVAVRRSEDGEILGYSKTAAWAGLGLSVVTRNLLLPLPLMALPSVLMRLVLSPRGPLGWHARRTVWVKTAVELACVTAAMGVSIPFCVAAVPQELAISVDWLEDDIKAKAKAGEMVKINRGI